VKPTYILGLSAYYHDSAACLLRDGEIVAAAQEERFTRRKGDSSFPKHAVDYCLRLAQIEPSDLAFVGFYDKPCSSSSAFWKPTWEYLQRIAFVHYGRPDLAQGQAVYGPKPERLARYDGRILYSEHHESHAASAFFPSPFKEAAILTMDGVASGPPPLSEPAERTKSS